MLFEYVAFLQPYARRFLTAIFFFVFTVKPKTVEIMNGRKPMSTKKMNEIVCKSSGSVPPAKISWWKGSKRMKSAKYYVSDDDDGSVTATSVLRYQPTNRDDGAFLTCRALNPKIEGSAIEDGFKMRVHCKYGWLG